MPVHRPGDTRPRAPSTTSAGLAAFCVLVAASASAQLPSVEAFLAEPLHTVRGRLTEEHYGDPELGLGVELTMPTSVDVGSLADDRMHFALHGVSLPTAQVVWAHGHSVDDLLGPAEDRVEHVTGYVRTETRGVVTRGEGWAARVWRSEIRSESDGSTAARAEVRVLVRVSSSPDLVCVGEGFDESPSLASAPAIRDWLLARCRSVRVVPAP